MLEFKVSIDTVYCTTDPANLSMVKIISSMDNDGILGRRIVDPRAAELLSEALIAVKFSASAKDVQPTKSAQTEMADAKHEVALAVDNRALSYSNR